jgi:GT2 family glycosyltransferase
VLNIVMPARNGRALTASCLKSLYHITRSIAHQVRFLLLDDASDPAEDLVGLFTTFRSQVESQVRIVRFRERRHYTGVFNYGLHRCEEGDLFFVSNDMVVTPSFLFTLLAVSALDEKIGIVRGTSQFVTGHPEYRVVPQEPLRDYEDIERFSTYRSHRLGLAFEEDKLLSGDAVLIKKKARSAVSHFDPRYYAYFSDLDYGLRVRRAGFSLVCALGAWLHHDGAGHLKQEAHQDKAPLEEAFARRHRMVQSDYLQFRDKWSPELPEIYRAENLDFDELYAKEPRTPEAPYSPPELEEF